MDRIKKNFGFGFMRLPMKDNEIDIPQTKCMVDSFLNAGFNYFDTAHGYLQEKSELAIKECLTSRYPRDSYVLTDKLTANYFNSEADIRPFFESQLDACGVTYFDFYLMHAQGEGNYPHFKKCRAYETAFELKKEGKIRHVGISFHDRAEFLEHILTEYPQIEVVQIQFNYADYNDPAVQARKCYEVCRKFGKPVIVMEPVKGGNLVNLPQEAKAVLENLHGGSAASYALRFAAGFPGIMMVISGMSNTEQLEDNISFMKDFRPLDEAELAAVEKVQEIIKSKHLIPCTACRYCTDGCPKQISIPDLFATLKPKSFITTGTLIITTALFTQARAERLPTASSAENAKRSAHSICRFASCLKTLRQSSRKRNNRKSERAKSSKGSLPLFCLSAACK